MDLFFVLYVIFKTFLIILRLLLELTRVLLLIVMIEKSLGNPVFDIFDESYLWLMCIGTNYLYFVYRPLFLISRLIFLISVLYFAMWVCVVIGEVIIDEIFAWFHWVTTTKVPIGQLVSDYWELNALVFSSNNDYRSPQFYPIVVCDDGRFTDPFRPQHASIVHVVEIRHRNMCWKTLIIWRVSMLDGTQTEVHHVNYFSRFTDGKPFSRTSIDDRLLRLRHDPVSAWQCDGVIFVDFLSNFLVLDTRYNVSKSYDRLWLYGYSLDRMNWRHLKGPFIRVDRLWDANGRVDGWRVRTIITIFAFAPGEGGHFLNFRYSPVVGWESWELKDRIRFIQSKDVRFGLYLHDQYRSTYIRTNGMFGLMVVNTNNGQIRTMLCDKWGKLEFFDGFDALRRFDRNFSAYLYTPAPTGNIRGELTFPTVITDEECIECTRKGEIFRTKFRIHRCQNDLPIDTKFPSSDKC